MTDLAGTEEHEMELRVENKMKQLDGELRAKVKVDRENRDMKVDQTRLKAEVHRVNVIESISAAGSVIGQWATTLLMGWNKVTTTLADCRWACTRPRMLPALIPDSLESANHRE